FPLILLVARRYRLRAAVSATLAAVLATHMLATSFAGLDKLNGLLPQFLGLFVLGVLAARATVVPAPDWLGRALAAGVVVIAGVFLTLAVTAGSTAMVEHFFGVDLLVGTGFAMLLGLLAGGSAPPLRRLFAARPL